MATIQEIKTKLLNANTLGRTNLSLKGVKLPDTATTYNIMQAIAEIVGSSGSGGATYTNIVYNTDNTITLTDKDGAVHTMSCTYEGGKLIGVTYDGKAVDLTYNGDALVKVGKTAVDVGNAPVNIAALDHTVTFTVDGEPYEIVSVKAGNSVNAPSTAPRIENLLFVRWDDAAGELVQFPFTPTEDTTISALFKSRSNTDLLYEKCGVNKTSFPYVCIGVKQNGDKFDCEIMFNRTIYKDNGTSITHKDGQYSCTFSVSSANSQDELVDEMLTKSIPVTYGTYSSYTSFGEYDKFYTNCVRTYSSGIVVEYLT